MLPSKTMMEYMTEMNRLFPGRETEDVQTPFPLHSDRSPFQFGMINKSSSSTDSTSPESCTDLSYHSTNYQPLGTPRLQHTSFITRPQRAIVGRKILGNSQQSTRLITPEERRERDFTLWQYEDPLSITPPGNLIQPKPNVYELFPSDNKALEFQTPVKSESKIFDISPNFSDRSPLSCNSPVNRSLSNLSPNQPYRSQGFSNQLVPVSLRSPTWSNSLIGSRIPSQRQNDFLRNTSCPQYKSKYQNLGACSSTDEISPSKMCTFCRKNGETPIVYMTHSVKEQVGGRHVVTCPILRSHVCATCGATGDNAHTITYCPVLRSNNNGKPLQSTTITLKNTRIKSNGRRRY